MDSVRLGRVLGRGARGAAKTFVSAIDAATAAKPRPSPPAAGAAPQPSPRPGPRPRQPASQSTRSEPTRPEPQLLRPPPPHTAEARPAPTPARPNFAEGGRRFGQAVWTPFVRLSGVLWLEFTGVFFGVFALSAGIGAWRLHGALHALPGDPARTHFLLALAVAVVFGYFCVSSFIRAARRGRRA